jgi:signal transduction histidine kinase
MRDLPTLVIGHVGLILPMSDHSAALLAELLLEASAGSHGAANPIDRLAEQLAQDPPLAVWVAIRSRPLDPNPPQTLPEAAQWLYHQALAVLQWQDNRSATHATARVEHQEVWADRVARSLELAGLAAKLASCRGHRASAEAALAAMCYSARAWFNSTEVPYLPLPEGWLLGTDPCEVGEASEILASRKPLVGGRGDPHARRIPSFDEKHRWLERVPGAGAALPALTGALARLKDLTTRFQTVLEHEKIEALAEFAAGAGHEINNPLANISGRAQLLLRDEPHPQRRRELATIVAQAQRAHEMIADLRLFARPPRPEPRRADLVRLVDDALGELASEAAERSITIVRSGDPGPIEAEIDSVQIRVAIHALGRNALEAIGCDGRIEVAVRRRGDQVEIRFSDDGPGILPEHRPHLFEPFYSARQAGRGLGMGLSKAWRIVTNHSGCIEVADTERGAVLSIVLPAARKDEG